MKTEILKLIQQSRLAKDPVKVEAYRLALAAIQSKESSKENRGKDLSDDDMIKCVKSERDKFYQASDCHEGELKVTYKLQGDLLDVFIPELIDPETYPKIVNAYIAKVDAKNISDMGNVMKPLREEYGTRLDYQIISGLVKSKLVTLST